MSKINCKADQCNYNSNQTCKKDQVQIDGKTAHDSSETCCQSFVEKDTHTSYKSK